MGYYFMTKLDLIQFEDEIQEEILAGHIRAPVHLSGGNENALIDIFKQIRFDDWVLSTHRSHYHALLKGIPREWVKREILEGRSITLNNSGFHFMSSAIVGGILPIGVGLAMTGQKVWCFIGDMASETGIFHECVKFSLSNNLPIRFVVEDNGYSVDTPTRAIWRYSYQRKFPHQGMGKYVIF